MNAIVRIDARFNGPPDSANGGYAAGLIAGVIGEALQVRLMRPVPLQRELQIREDEANRWAVLDGEHLVAIATPTLVTTQAPPAIAYIEALGVSRHFVGFAQHAFPTCFVCGPARSAGDGLRIFPGAVPGAGVVAAPWLPDRSLDDGRGKVRPEFIWAALDCPGYFASPAPAPALLGELAVHVDRPVHVDEPCVIVGWPITVEGRKHRVGSALFDEDGERCALAVATWIGLRDVSAPPPSQG
ncbi:MAG: hypothetical protein RBS02_06755 [Steroidobacteraceae bacterium]|jgi:hypothetical protein|nr:hypothetical protein [Steroidobacteraceae bacterium]